MTTATRNKATHTYHDLTFSDGPLIGLGIRVYHSVIEGLEGENVCVVSSSPAIVHDSVKCAPVSVEIISEPTRRAVREKVARGVAKLYYHVKSRRDVKFGRGVTGMSFKVVMPGVSTPNTQITYDMLISTDELLGTR